MSWDLSEERAFIEDLLSKRFNFFLMFFSLVIVGAMNARSAFFFKSIIILGAIISWLLALTIFRSQKKLDILLEMIFEDSNHPATKADKECSNKGSKRKLIGYAIPLICCCFLTIISLLALANVIKYQ